MMKEQAMCAECGRVEIQKIVPCAGECREPMPLCDVCYEEFESAYTCELCLEEAEQERQDDAAEEEKE
jgi:hypothetical protein